MKVKKIEVQSYYFPCLRQTTTSNTDNWKLKTVLLSYNLPLKMGRYCMLFVAKQEVQGSKSSILSHSKHWTSMHLVFLTTNSKPPEYLKYHSKSAHWRADRAVQSTDIWSKEQGRCNSVIWTSNLNQTAINRKFHRKCNKFCKWELKKKMPPESACGWQFSDTYILLPLSGGKISLQ